MGSSSASGSGDATKRMAQSSPKTRRIRSTNRHPLRTKTRTRTRKRRIKKTRESGVRRKVGTEERKEIEVGTETETEGAGTETETEGVGTEIEVETETETEGVGTEIEVGTETRRDLRGEKRRKKKRNLGERTKIRKRKSRRRGR